MIYIISPKSFVFFELILEDKFFIKNELTIIPSKIWIKKKAEFKIDEGLLKAETNIPPKTESEMSPPRKLDFINLNIKSKLLLKEKIDFRLIIFLNPNINIPSKIDIILTDIFGLNE